MQRLLLFGVIEAAIDTRIVCSTIHFLFVALFGRSVAVSTALTRSLQGYLTHEKKRTPLGLYRRTMRRVLGGSWGGGTFAYERGTPVDPQPCVGEGRRGICGRSHYPRISREDVTRSLLSCWLNKLSPESRGQNLALTVLCVPCSLDSGLPFERSVKPTCPMPFLLLLLYYSQA